MDFDLEQLGVTAEGQTLYKTPAGETFESPHFGRVDVLQRSATPERIVVLSQHGYKTAPGTTIDIHIADAQTGVRGANTFNLEQAKKLFETAVEQGPEAFEQKRRELQW